MTRHRVTLSARAQKDLTRIGDYLAEQAGDATAKRWAEKLGARVASLADPMLHAAPHPGLGRDRRTLVERPYVIIYSLPQPGEVLVSRVAHGARDLPGLFSDHDV